MRKAKDFIWKILIKIGMGGPVQLMLTGDLRENGWYKSFNQKQSVDKDGKPIPWNTYSYTKFIEPRLQNGFSIFEFGGGNSTIWYAERVESIVAVEHDKKWVEYISKRMPSNAKIIYRELTADGDYSKEVHNSDNKYNIIIIDGRDRNNCAKNSMSCLTDDGVIVFDNSNLPNYVEAIDFLRENGFKRLDFWGMSPVTPHTNCTSIFYKSENCLKI